MHTLTSNRIKLLGLSAATCGLVGLSGCHLDMWIQPKAKAQQESQFFADKSSSRLPVQGTMPRGHLKDDEPYYTGYNGNALLTEIPERALASFPGAGEKERRLAMLKRGQERFNIYCQPCHGRAGDGNGMIAIRGLSLRRPPGNYHTQRLRDMPIGHFYDVIVNGYGSMYSYASRIQDPNDRWAIAAYIRVLQRSQNASINDAPADLRSKLETEQAIMMDKESKAEAGSGASGGATPEGGAH